MSIVEDGITVDEENEIKQDSPYNIHRQDVNENLMVCTNLEEGPNLAVLFVEGDTCTNNLHVYIDDTDIKWKEGQTLKLKIKDYIDFDGNFLYIHTGLENGVWNQHIVIPSENISTTPTIEIICTDEIMKQTKSSFIYESFQSGNSGSSSSGSTPSEGSEMTSTQIDDIIRETLDN